jgi:hypothetical protein
VMKNIKKRASSREGHFPKTLFALFQCKIADDDGSRDLLSRSQMHINERDEVALVAQQRRRQKPRCISLCLVIVTSSVAVARIYREDPPRVAASYNRLALSLSKRIRYGVIVKINGKKRS